MRTSNRGSYSRLSRVACAFLGGFVLVAGTLPAAASHRTRESSSLRRKIDALDNDKVENLRIPILLGVEVDDLQDTWGDARAGGREHEGTDIFAPRGAFIVSPTDAVVTSIGVGANGGNYVYTANPGGERLYFAHLDDYADGLDVGDVLKPGDLIGYVGNTGNAIGTSPHLHLGIYDRGAENPFPRLTKVFTLRERIEAIDKILDNTDEDEQKPLAARLVVQYRGLFVSAQAEGITLPPDIKNAMEVQAVVQATTVTRDLTLGSQGADVKWLQEFLIRENKGFAARSLADAGATGYFGTRTQAALAEYQRAEEIVPAAGYFGPLTRAHIQLASAEAALR